MIRRCRSRRPSVQYCAPYELLVKIAMRASIQVLGPLVARFGYHALDVSLPGG